MLRFGFYILCFCFFTLKATTELPANTHLHGWIKNEKNKAVANALLYFHDVQKTIQSDEHGYYVINNLNPGAYHVHILCPGYQTTTEWFTIKKDTQEINFILQQSAIELSEVLIESYSKFGNQKQAQSIISIDKKYLEENLGNTFVESLENLPGVSAIKTGSNIAKPIVRGMGFNRVMVTDKGIKQEGQQWGAEHGLELDQFDVEHVEIIKGASALIYGSDAMGGVINIQSPKPLPLNTIKGEWKGVYKNNNDLYGGSIKIEGNQEGFLYKLRYSNQNFSRYQVPANSFNYGGFVLPIYNGELKNTAGSEQNLSLGLGIHKNWGYSMLYYSWYQLTSGLFPGAVGFPRAFLLFPDDSRSTIGLPYQTVAHHKIIHNNNIKLGNHWLELNWGFQHNDRAENIRPDALFFDPLALPDYPDYGNLALGLKLNTYSLNTKLHHLWRENWKNIYGIQSQLQYNTHNGFEFILPNYQSFQLGTYVYSELDYSKQSTWSFGLRWDMAQHDIAQKIMPVFNRQNEFTGDFMERNPNINRFFNNFSGAVGISGNQLKKWKYKANLATAFRFPIVNELASNGVHHGMFRHEIGNATLNPERGFQADFLLNYQSKIWHLNASPFVAYYNQFIYLSPTGTFSTLGSGGTIWEYRQDNVTYSGFELSSDFHPIEGLHINQSVEYVYNYNFQTSLSLPFTPPLKLINEIDYHFHLGKKKQHKIKLGATHLLTNAQNFTDRNELTTAGYHLFNCKIGYDIVLNNQLFKFQLMMNNLTNQVYFNHLSRYRLLNIPEQGRNIVFSMSIPFQKTFQKTSQ